MCLIGLHYKALAGTVLLLAANRDEYYRRPSAALGPWPDQPEVFGGRDLQGGGSWLALHRNGRFAAVTNVRMGLKPPPQALSRGSLVTDYVCGQLSSLEFAHHLTQQSRSYAPFNLLFGRVDDLYCYHSPRHTLTRLTHGVFGLSNAQLNTSWPKVERLKHRLQGIKRLPAEEELFSWLQDAEHPPLETLPNTGVGTTLERLLSPVFIQSDDYGTTSSTILMVRSRGDVIISEQGYHAGRPTQRNRFIFKLDFTS